MNVEERNRQGLKSLSSRQWKQLLGGETRYRLEIRRYGEVVKEYATRDLSAALSIWRRYNGLIDPIGLPASCWVSVYINGAYQNYARMERLCLLAERQRKKAEK